MKPVLIGDAIALARVLYLVDEPERVALIQQIFSEAAEAADFAQHRQRTHPRFGNGSVMAACANHAQVSEPTLENKRFCACLRVVFAALADR